MTNALVWYALRQEGRRWLFAPSKFVGYPDNTAEASILEAGKRDGRETEDNLQQLFQVVQPDTVLADELDQALKDFLQTHRHSRPNKRARICVAEVIPNSGAKVPDIRRQIDINPAICGGRPHIRGTRVRVSDILELMASGESFEKILADFPYLREADIRAALAYGANATDHRIVPAA